MPLILIFFGGGGLLQCVQGWHLGSAFGCRPRSEDVLTAGCVERENSRRGQAKCGKCSHSQTEVSFIKYFPPGLPLPSPASHVCHHVTAWWSGQDFSLAPLPQHAASSGARKGCWLFLTAAACSMPWRCVSAGSGCSALPRALPEKDPSYLTVGSAVGAVERGMEPSKAGGGEWRWTQGSWKQAVGLTVLSLSPSGDKNLPFAAIPPHFGIIYVSWAVLLLSTLHEKVTICLPSRGR